ncbi:acyltransferase family protein [Luteolibacter marinus]|uniref:acyltransferase family protein n=1 Tax=Luteolibacter marinus TaxID=2776705 RepID=UPI0018670699|nr:acyltransferase family protein [Luteolibacter marinus]
MIHAKSMAVDDRLIRTTSVGDPSPAAILDSTKSQRFFHLDALRASLMFWGILVHVSTVAKVPFFRMCAEISGLVRMEAFFVISGFLAYMLLKKYGARRTLKKRLVAIGVPFVTALVLLNPVTNWLVYSYHNHSISFRDFLSGEFAEPVVGPVNWHLHLWFLVALFVYTILAPLIERGVDTVVKMFGPKETVRSCEVAFLTMAVVVTAGCIVARVAFEYAFEPLLPSWLDFVTRSVGNYLPFYVLGMLLFASTPLRRVFSSAHWVQTVVSCVMLYAAHHLPASVPNLVVETLVLSAQTYAAFCLSSLLIWLAEKWVGSESRTARFLSESAYTVYLFHFVVIYMIAFALRGWIGNDFLRLSVISLATFISTLGIQCLVIRRIPLLELLFNGRIPKRPR